MSIYPPDDLVTMLNTGEEIMDEATHEIEAIYQVSIEVDGVEYGAEATYDELHNIDWNKVVLKQLEIARAKFL